jgi:hypothetical protein
MIRSRQPHPSHLFTVRLWLEEAGGGQFEWRGKAQHVLNGEAIYFREWSSLSKFLLGCLTKPGGAQTPPSEERRE